MSKCVLMHEGWSGIRIRLHKQAKRNIYIHIYVSKCFQCRYNCIFAFKYSKCMDCSVQIYSKKV